MHKAAIPDGVAALCSVPSSVSESQRMEQKGRGSPDKVSLHIAATGNKISLVFLQSIFRRHIAQPTACPLVTRDATLGYTCIL